MPYIFHNLHPSETGTEAPVTLTGASSPVLAEKAHHLESKCCSISHIDHATAGGVNGATIDEMILDELASDIDFLREILFSIKWTHLNDK